MRLLLFGPPGSGKGTQSIQLAEIFHLEHLSTGEMLRAAVRAGTSLGKIAKPYMDSGGLVPDETIMGVVNEEIERITDDFVLDGYPRTKPQALNLDDKFRRLGITLTGAFLLELPLPKIKERLTLRRSCPNCKEIYHLLNKKPKKNETCDKCQTPLLHRDDDTDKIVEERYKKYEIQTLPAIEHYADKKILQKIDGNRPADEVTKQLAALVSKLAKEQRVP